MDLYRSDHPIINGIQVSSEKLLNGSIRNIDKNKVIVTTQYAIVTTVKGNEKAVNGDWILQSTDGNLVVMQNQVFKHLYRKF